MSTHNLTTLQDAMQELRKRGYDKDFRLDKTGRLVINGTGKTFAPEEVQIREELRFEGDSNPDDMSILYAIETKSGEKGLVVNGYGISANEELDQFLQQAGA
jgi:hypothetical protein